MKLKFIKFKNYKAFSEEQEIEFKPITFLIGKNSSGKSAIAKLMTLIENSLSGIFESPLLYQNNGVDLGNEFTDLIYNKYPSSPLELVIGFEDGKVLSISIIQPVGSYVPIILNWHLKYKEQEYLLQFQPEENLYLFNGVECECTFRGFIPISIIEISTGNDKIDELGIINFKISVDYIGPFRLVPPRTFSLKGQTNFEKTGIEGENAYGILGFNKLSKSDLVHNVGSWFKEHFDGWLLDVYTNNYPILEVVLTRESKPESFRVNIVDVGQGMSQALPLVVRAFMNSDSSLIVLEQPELHLHPAAHADLSQLFAESALQNNHNYLIETHSENILLRIRKLIVDDNSELKSDNVIIYWVEEGETEGQTLKRITIDDKGSFNDWPESVFNENIEEVVAIKDALKRRKTEKQ